MLKRDSYLNRMIHHMWNGEVKVITGIRRCGKSVLLFDLFYEYLLSQEVQEDHIIKIELDQRRYYKFRNPITLCEYVEDLVSGKKDEKFYLFIDEVQLTTKVIDKENGDIEVSIYDMLNELKAYKNLDVYVTGSNSKGLSKDIATEFRGRATQIHVFPLSFEEFYSHVGGDERNALDTYMLYGGMPRLLALTDEKDKKDYLSSLYSELYVKDIVERNGIEREDILNDILDFLASQISSLTNPTNIANALTSMKNEKVNSTLVSNYVQHIIDSFLISMAKRYDVKGKTYFKYPNKYYYTDIGLRNARLNYRQYDPGHIMENIIYNELLRRGYSVDVGVVTDRTGGANVQKEIDFIVNDADKKIYIQSAFQMDTDKKESSELASLILTKDFFKKIIVRMDIPHNFYDDNGIFHCNLIDLLLGRVELF
ncbi:ATP-binding protein [Acutalibacter muris]|uniref:ATP-binding protein n=1 Tax=Acutalibacter muris TaxID=1796620 RepID=A0A1Z2XPQ9_9FIRM|nr:ATP-binding protein [Acutalibacter muris]ANU52893.1 ATPase [Hungateiclostridiaceae bacterium KB18]ASB40435.1 ATPase [Acutalibacter muris]QQR29726.1 ATP-binding protein [Acutalibacter muris]